MSNGAIASPGLALFSQYDAFAFKRYAKSSSRAGNGAIASPGLALFSQYDAFAFKRYACSTSSIARQLEQHWVDEPKSHSKFLRSSADLAVEVDA
ncbi:hypothetical protein TTRE_0000016701 [Trichuris trichiura]|uniref:Uncharacterized protein n=1 Tax=Trichuris trichiura TaxID=36087 RepID=A0A077YWR3_TRITR|nr:hypothetical protein TTRE_0000016701 [Trichuris trichiura]